LNLNKMTINIQNKVKKINLSEKKVLMKMLSSPGKIFSRAEIGKIANIFKERSIDVMITRLRKKIEIDPNKLLSSKIGEAELNLNKMTIKIKDKLKKINSSEKKVLMKMLSSPGKIFSRTDIDKIASISKERSIDVMITRLRKKIELDPKNPKFLQTIRGSGYVLWVK